MQSRWSQNGESTVFVPRLQNEKNAWLGPSVGNCVRSGVALCEARGKLGCCLRWLSTILLGGLTAAACTGAWLCFHNLHLRFWLGVYMHATLATLAVALGLSFFAMGYKAWLTAYRLWQRELRKRNQGRCEFQNQEAPLVLSLRSLRCVFLLVALSAAGSIGLGCAAFYKSHVVFDSLKHRCGHGGTMQALEATYQDLRAFEEKCHKLPENKHKGTHECPGYAEAFPAPAAFAGYIRLLEWESGCMGFCHHARRALFAVSKKEVPFPDGCAAYLGDYIWRASLAVSSLAVALGSCLLFLGLALLSLEEL